jgi:hypothetical protein
MAPPTEVHDKFESKSSETMKQRRMSSFALKKKPNVLAAHSLTPMWAGIAGQVLENNTKFEIGTCLVVPRPRDLRIDPHARSHVDPRLGLHHRLRVVHRAFHRE